MKAQCNDLAGDVVFDHILGTYEPGILHMRDVGISVVESDCVDCGEGLCST